jgi:hemoglobin
LTEDQIYSAIGEEGFARLIAAFYRRIPGDDILGPMYPAADLAGAEERLRDFLVGRFGGPMRYIEQRGHPRLRIRHAQFVVNERSRDRWIGLMMAAMDEARLPAEPRALLEAFFRHTADFLRNRPG